MNRFIDTKDTNNAIHTLRTPSERAIEIKTDHLCFIGYTKSFYGGKHDEIIKLPRN